MRISLTRFGSFMLVAIILLVSKKTDQLTGAWHVIDGNIDDVLIFQDGYFTRSIYDLPQKKFIRSYGGKYEIKSGKIVELIEFDTDSGDNVGKQNEYSLSISGFSLKINTPGGIREWKRTDGGKGDLAGTWRITARMNNGQLQQLQRSSRKTLKIISGARFQWMAINPDTKEFFGTGGGIYTFRNGKYTEKIEFFSRDSSRVGVSLEFDGSVNKNIWTHKGFNSRGEPLHEEWTREQ